MVTQQKTAKDITERLDNLKTKISSHNDSLAQKDALSLARQLVTTLEQPENVAVELAFSPFVAIAARVAVQLDLFKHIASYGKPVTSDELASLSGGEELLIATPLTLVVATEEIAPRHRMVSEMIVRAASQAPRYFREAGHQCPTDPHDGLMQYAFRTKLTTFELLKTMPDIFKDFNMFMGNTMGARHYWFDWFPVQDRLLDGATAESALLVDGRLVLQDFGSVTDNIKGIDLAIEVMGYDFFTEQPVGGARAYFYHHILHDWSDAICLEILKRVKKAMRRGYSKLLIHEMIIPAEGASAFHAVLDMTMMAFNAGME
ncbi:putative O-methyltransferase [Xylaria palmicola]|nr:putative O-methyltransferase [Xylaria palmicola]